MTAAWSYARGTHKFIDYPEKHAKRGSCVRCGKLPGDRCHA